MQKMQKWIESEDWSDVICEVSAHRKMEILRNLLVSKYYEHFPEKTRTISSDDEPYFIEKLSKLKRRKYREFNKNRKSKKGILLNGTYSIELEKAKKGFCRMKIQNLRRKNDVIVVDIYY